MNFLDDFYRRAEELGWEWLSLFVGDLTFSEERRKITLWQFSPLGEEISLEINGNDAWEVMHGIESYFQDFQADKHAEKYIAFKGQFGIPKDEQALRDDAIYIHIMLGKLYIAAYENAYNHRNEAVD